MAKVKLQLANTEAAQSGLTDAPHSQSTFILLALEIEDLQCVYIFPYRYMPTNKFFVGDD